MSSSQPKPKKQRKPRKPHPVLHGIGLVLASLLSVVILVANLALSSMAGIIDGFIGAPSANVSDAVKQDTLADAVALAAQIQGESTVLLQNKDNTLPLAADVTKVNVFGWASTAWLGGGSGSGGVSKTDVDLLAALEAKGIAYNTELTEMYRNFQAGRDYVRTLSSAPEQSCRLYEPDIDDTNYYTTAMLDAAKAYSDTAIVVLGRLAGESNDCTQQQYKRTTKDGEIVVDESRTYLEPSVEEEKLLAYVGQNYKNVIVLLNTGNVMELGLMETIPGVDAVLAVGLTGQNAASALPAVLWGEVSPTGRTADTWAYDLTTAASYANAGADGVGRYTNADGLYPADGTTSGNFESPVAYTQVSYVDYAEGIYIGYKWYETADAEGYWDTVSNEYGTGYEGVVQYPFGFGLSYTDFDWTIVDAPKAGTALDKDSTLSVTVRVTNTGKAAGQDVVQLYYTAPYLPGEIEKSSVELADFAKTKLLQPGESEELTLQLTAYEMASYDALDANRNGFAGYELDPGEYVLSVRHDAHTPDDDANATVALTLGSNVQYPTDPHSGAEVSNKFTGPDAMDGVSLDGSDSAQNIVWLTRADFAGTFPKQNVDERPMTDNVAALNLFDAAQAEAYINEADGPIKTGAKGSLKIEDKNGTTELGYQLGSDYDDPQWDALLDQITVEEMEKMFIQGYGGTSEIKSIGKLKGSDADGPAQIGGFTGMNAGTGFPSSSTLAQSWNRDLAQQMGHTIGTQALQNGYMGWYAPAVNMHRSPFNGRNYEYYSEDSVLSGELCGSTVDGAQKAGTYCYVKHFICNDGESGTYRDSVYLWMPEQALREVYLEPFRTIVEKYDGVGLMTSYNRIGAVWAGGSKALLTGILGEWGYHGGIITDYCDHHSFMNGDQALRAGGSLWMSGMMGGSLAQETSSNSYMQALRRATKDTLYMYLHVRVVNRDYAQALGDDTLLRPVFTKPALGWRHLVAVIDIVVVLLLVLAIRAVVRDVKFYRDRKKDTPKQNET